ncbi:phage tail tape measure protein [Streptomyces sp. XC 2026]|uniref:phage tail tape measure protein n=3 Tax=Actinomycetes TaxID=1760 RepID=UPI001906D86C|nr:phage tail tape measure protein [Streptomyces sp. XC 2026]QQN79709.1 phage tail tape measure protein [Streptomyces sp. XC 2026]QQN80594.1 phage tail tape measure protein [Streptomyces sp. XC 2026]
MATEVGVGYIRLLPSMRGFGPDAQRMLTGVLVPAGTRAGQAAGRAASDGIAGGMQSAGSSITNVGTTLTAGLTAPVAGLGAMVLRTAGDFEAGMNGVRAVTGATGQDFEDLRALAKDMGATTAFSATEAAAAMEFLGMAGFQTSDIMSALPDVLNLAAAGNTDLATTADIASNIMSGFGIEASETARVADVLARTMTSTNVDLTMLGESMKYAAPLAKAAGWSFEETAAAVGFLGNAGIQGSMAGTGLNSILATLADTSSTGGRRLAEFGVAAQDSTGQVRPLTDILTDLADQGADVADIIGIFGLEAGPKLQALLGQGSDGIRELIADLEDSEGAAKEMADIRMEGFAGSVKELKSAFEGLLITIGEAGLLDWATQAAQKLTGFVQNLNDTNPELLRWGAAIGLAVAAAGPLLMIFGQIASGAGAFIGIIKGAGTALGVLTGPVGLVALAVAGIAAAFIYAYQSSEDFRDTVDEAVGRVKDIIMGVWTDLQPTFQQLKDVWNGILDAITGMADGSESKLDGITRMIQDKVDAIVGIIQAAVDFIVMVWDNWGEDIIDIVYKVWTSIQEQTQGALQMIQGFIEIWTGVLSGDWSKAWEGAKRVVKGAWEFIVARIKGSIELGLTILRTVLSTIRGAISSAWEAAKRATKAAWNWIYERIRDALTDARRAVSDRISDIVEKVRDIKRRIQNVFTNAKDWLWSAGRKVVQGLIDGIGSMVQQVRDTMSNIVSGIRDYLPFSPAKTGPLRIHPPDEAGRTIGTMLATGLRSSSGAVQSASALMASSAVALPPGATSAARAAAQPAAPVVQITAGDRHLIEWLRNMVRTDHGGSVQAALGQAGR